ncbi:MAG: DmsE family decaheme c-type cytochrome [Acidobacteriota bacterium]|nr:DmsE family decaheme c-type cytochrome [Acidobacteriota bacterium]
MDFTRKVRGYRTPILLTLCLLLPVGVIASSNPGKAKADQPLFVGEETCKGCHDDIAKRFDESAHKKMALLHGGAGVTCENCHGSGKAHVDGGGDTSKIFNPAKHSAKEVDAKCQTCHAGAHPNFDRSPHAKANVGCISCHSIHQSKDEKLLKVSQTKLCLQCHSDVKPAFSMPFHHKVNEGLVQCSDCHDAHGTFNANNVKSTADQNAICTKCHTEVRGPFVYEHAPVKAEGCMGCHTPHGSQNPRMLNMPAINPLCNQCHSGVAANTVHGMGAGSSVTYPCTTCHTYIHGSNMNTAFIR